MNNTLTHIADQYAINHDQIPSILDGLKVKDVKKLDDRQIKGFENVCRLLQEKQPLDQALAQVIEQARNDHGLEEEAPSETQTQNLIIEDSNETDIEQTTTEQPQEEKPQPKASKTVTSNSKVDLKQLGMTDEQIAFLSEQQVQGLIQTLAMVGYAERQRVIAKFLEMSRQKLDQALRSPEVVQQFQNVFTDDIVPPHLLEGMPKIQFTLPGN